MTTKTVKLFNSSKDMLDWQMMVILQQLDQVQLHASDETCPCRLRDMGEYCIPKHLNLLASLANETAAMDQENFEILDLLGAESTKYHRETRDHVCSKGDNINLVSWSRAWRKKIEPIYYSCKKARVHDVVYNTHQPKSLIINAGLTGIVPREYLRYKVQLTLNRSKAWNIQDTPKINSTEAVQPIFKIMRNADREWLLTICLDNQLRLIGLFEQAIGTYDSAMVSPLEVARIALTTGASSIIMVHNHPSGNPEPSSADKNTFQSLKDALKPFDVMVHDFIVVGQKTDYSIAGEQYLPVPANEIARVSDPAAVKIAGKCDQGACEIKVTATEKTEATTSSIKNLDKIIKQVEERSARARVKTTNKTFAMGSTGVTRYELEFRILDAGALIVSNNPFTFAPNPDYPQELQPRNRERAATRLQVESIAANLEPDALLTDYKSIDRGAPIIGADNIVESGNGRVMALILAAKEHPEVYAKYKSALKAIAPNYSLSAGAVDDFKTPILVRVRLSKVSRRQFVEEANASATIESSAVEKARTDAGKISQSMLNALDILENEAIEDGLRAVRNKSFVTAFLSKLPQNEQAKLVDSKGILNQDGVRRMAMAIFVATFRGDVGLKLAEKFFESTDINVRNVFNGIGRCLGTLARAETLAFSGERYPDYSIGQDLAQTISVYSAVKKTPGMTVNKYLSQSQMLERELTPFQERILLVLDQNSKSAKKISVILTHYADAVINSASPSQASFMPAARETKNELFENAVSLNQAMVEDIATVRDYKWMAKKLARCNLKPAETEIALNWRPLRDFLAYIMGLKKPVELCSAGMVEGVYQLTIRNLTEKERKDIVSRGEKIPGFKQVFELSSRNLIYEIVVPDPEKDKYLNWSRQEVNKSSIRPASQASLFDIKPKEILIYSERIEQHYLPAASMHPGSIRILKYKNGVVLYLGCPKKEIWDQQKIICSRQTVIKTIVPRSAHYLEQARKWNKDNVPVKEISQNGIVRDLSGDTECVFVIYQDQDGRRFRGPTYCGDRTNADFKIDKHRNPVQVHHNHPSQIPYPSEIDMETARQYNVDMCVHTKSGINCFVP